MKFSVWAPHAKEITIVLDAREVALSPTERGWWEAEIPDAGPGTRYAYRINGEGPFPDPRSPWQPDGVHASSMVIDHFAFPWTDGGFQAPPFSDAIIYELHVGTFTPAGTYLGAIEKLPHLRDLGVNFIELLPLNTFAGPRGWGYDGVALFAPHPAYGSPDDLRKLVQAAHAHGIGMLIDVVYNHFGPDGNYAPKFGPYFTDHFSTPWGDGVNVGDTDSCGVRAHFIDNALMWLRDYHFDGLRMDAVDRIVDLTAYHFLEEIADRVAKLSEELGRPLVVTVENDTNNPRLVHPVARGGFGLTAHWCDDFHHAVHANLTGETSGYYADYTSLADLAKALRQGYVHDGGYSKFRRRNHGRPPIDVRPEQLVVCAQNHDQIGNRAFGERIGHLVDEDLARAAAALTLLSPFTPLIFMGEEWNASTPFQFFSAHHDELGRLVTEGRRREFAGFNWGEEVPDPQAPETFAHSRLNWEEISLPEHAAMLAWYRALIALRREIPRGTGIEVNFDETARWLTFTRGDLLAAFNFADRPQVIPRPEGRWTLALSWPESTPDAELPAHATQIFRRRR